VAAAVVLPPEPDRLAVELAGVADSKLVRPAVREKLEQLGITEQDVEDAVAWARQ